MKAEETLRSEYGGQQFHLRSNDNRIEKVRYGYLDFNNNALINNHCSSQPVLSTHTPFADLTNSKIFQSANFHKPTALPKLLGRYCDTRCQIPSFWASRIYANLTTIFPIANFKLLQNNIVSFESCAMCKQASNNKCNSISSCNDNLRVVKELSNHYQALRTLIRQLYDIRNQNLIIIQIDKAMLESNLIQLLNLTQFNCKRDVRGPMRLTLVPKQLNVNIEQFENLNKSVNTEMQRKLANIECIICHRLFVKDRVRTIPEKYLNNPVFQQLTNNYTHNLRYICREQCFKQLFINEQIPIYSQLNNMKLELPPSELTSLNIYERMLTQLGKCFHNIIRLQFHRKNYGAQAALGMKGISIHLPLNFNETHGYLANQLPNADTINIIIEGLPTKAGNIWRQLVNLDKVYKALNWLSHNNIHYSTISILPRSHFNSHRSCLLLPEKTQSLTKEEISTLSYIKESNSTISHYSVIDLDKINENISALDKYACKRVTAVPLTDRDQNIDHYCFPIIYPYGRGGMLDKRLFEVKPAMYIRWLLQHAIPIARRDQQFIFSTIHRKQIRQAEQGIHHQLHTSRKSKMTAGEIKQKIENNNQELESGLSNTLAAVNGSKEYWNLKCSDLNFLDERLGSAGWFLTLSFSEYNDEMLHQYLITMNSDLPNVEKMTLNELIHLDPVSVSNYFEKKFRTFFRLVIRDPNGPFGVVEHYWWRREYQQRGIPHIHSKLWTRGAPIYGVDSDEDVLKYITSKVTCRIPDKDKEPELFDLVMKYQIHKCNSSCQRLVFNKTTKKKALLCRYGFPRPVQPFASLNSVERALKSQYSSGSKRTRLYNLERKENEAFVNDYNPLVLLIWKNNIDVQFIGTAEQALNRYVTGYMTKSEKNNTAEIWNECNNNKTLHGRLKSFALKSFKTREIGIYEAADRLNGRASCEGSDEITYLNPIEASARPRKLKKFSEIKKLQTNDSNIFHTNVIDTYYPNRPQALVDMCLYDFVSQYDFISKPCTHLGKTNSRCYQLNAQTGYICYRSHTKLVKLSNIKVFDSISREKYFHHMLISFKPWLSESELKADYSTYQEAFEDATKNENTNKLYTQFNDQRKRIEAAIKFCNNLVEEANETNDAEIESINEADVSVELTDSQQRLLNLGVADLPAEYLKKTTIEEFENSLNIEQKEIFDNIINHIHHQDLHKRLLCQCNETPTGLRRFISGVAGKKLVIL